MPRSAHTAVAHSTIDAQHAAEQAFAQALRAHQAGDHQAALARVEAALAAGLATPDLLNLAGVAAKRLGQRDAAERFYRQVLQHHPQHGATLNNLAILLQENGASAAACELYAQALALTPDDILPRLNLGNLHLAAHRLDEAEAAYRQALALAPDMPEVWRSLAELHVARDDPAAARAALGEALQRRPTYAEARQRLADLLREDGQLAAAAAQYRQLLGERPRDGLLLNRLGEVLQAQGQREAAEHSYRQALQVDPDNPEILNNLGILLHERKAYAESEIAYRRALALKPAYAEAWNNLAVLVQKQKRFREAEAAYQAALAITPDYPAARCNYGLLCLTEGRFAEGWPLYEARYAPGRTVATPKLSRPQWQGEPLAGKSILIWNEQGLGDEIQFARYAQYLKAQGARYVGLVCKKPLTRLLTGLAGVDMLHEEERRFSIKPYDYWTFPLSIPRYFCPSPADIPRQAPYLHADPALQRKWAARLGQGYRVGLVWKGRAEYSNDANRSVPDLRLLAPLWSIPGLSMHSLQKGEGEAEAAAPPPGQPMIPLGADFTDLSDTAAVVSQLDLVICVDTAIAHLCGALGVPCWVMLPFTGTDWRWLLGRDDSPWYPSLRLFRQPAPDAWGAVVDALCVALRERRAMPQAAGEAAWLDVHSRLRRLSADDRALVDALIARLADLPGTPR